MDDAGNKRLVNQHLREPKTGNDVEIGWTPGRAAQRIRFDVGAGQLVMTVGGKFQDASEQQLWLFHPKWRHGQHQAVRLCVTKLHGSVPHWHWLDERRNLDESLDRLDLGDPGTLLLEVFIPRLKIDGVIYTGRLL